MNKGYLLFYIYRNIVQDKTFLSIRKKYRWLQSKTSEKWKGREFWFQMLMQKNPELTSFPEPGKSHLFIEQFLLRNWGLTEQPETENRETEP